MKKIILFLLLVKIDMTYAGSEPAEYIVSPDVPLFQIDNFSVVLENQSFFLWDYIPSGCWESYSDSYVEYQEHTINVFNHELGGVCASPPPPPHYVSIAEIDGLSSGSYQLNFYSVPRADAFPPDPSDQSNYLVSSFSFRVFGIVTVDSLSQYSMVILVLLLLTISRKKLTQLLR